MVKRKDKNGQLKIQQMSFMLIAVFLLFVLVGLFYLGYHTISLQKDAIELKKERTQYLITKIASTPELIYQGRANSIDSDKLILLKSDEKYKDLWGVEGIIVQIIYPQKNNLECKLSNYPDCQIIKLFTTESVAPIFSFVSLCRKENGENGAIYDKCEIAKIMIKIKDEITIGEN